MDNQQNPPPRPNQAFDLFSTDPPPYYPLPPSPNVGAFSPWSHHFFAAPSPQRHPSPNYVNHPSPMYQNQQSPLWQHQNSPMYPNQQSPNFQTNLNFSSQTSSAFQTEPSPQQEEEEQQQQEQQQQEEEEEEIVRETQEPPNTAAGGSRKKRMAKKKSKANPNGPAPARKWTPDEESALAQAYIDATENTVEGNSQKADRFWNTVEHNFHTILGVPPYRSKHQVTTKWKDMNAKLTKFSGIYNNNWANRASGESDDIILSRSLEEYRYVSNGTAFNHIKAWEIVKQSPRWMPVPETPSSKRSRTSNDGAGSSDAHCFADLNLSDEETPEAPNPPGRNRTRKTPSHPGSTSSRATLLSDEVIEKLTGNLDHCVHSFDNQMTIERLRYEELKLARELAATRYEAERRRKEERDEAERKRKEERDAERRMEREERRREREEKKRDRQRAIDAQILALNANTEEAQEAIRAMQRDITRRYRGDM